MELIPKCYIVKENKDNEDNKEDEGGKADGNLKKKERKKAFRR